jgi:hypothetical protein
MACAYGFQSNEATNELLELTRSFAEALPVLKTSLSQHKRAKPGRAGTVSRLSRKYPAALLDTVRGVEVENAKHGEQEWVGRCSSALVSVFLKANMKRGHWRIVH